MIAWSHSRLESFETFAFRFFQTSVHKSVPDPPGEAATWGTTVHAALEARLTHDGTELPKTLKAYEPYAQKVESMVAPGGKLYAEQRIALTQDLKFTEFFDKNAWVRLIADVLIDNGESVIVLDWKTGKRKENTAQLNLTAAVVPSVYPKAQVIHTGYVWLKDKKVDIAQYQASQAKDLWKQFLPRVARLEQAHATNTWEKRPSGLCRRWCPVRECEHCGS